MPGWARQVMMKRARIRLQLVVVLILAAALVTVLFTARSPSPRFVPGRQLPAGTEQEVDFGWDGAALSGGKIWGSIEPSNNTTHTYYVEDFGKAATVQAWIDRCYFLYDLDQRTVLGQLLNAEPVFLNRDQTKLLCRQVDPSSGALKKRLAALAWNSSGGKIKLPWANETEVLWVLNLQNNCAVKIGRLIQRPRGGSDFVRSPGFRFGYTIPTTSTGKPEFFLCDLEQNSLTKINATGELTGWWDEHDILIKSAFNDFVLFDVLTRKTTTLFGSEAVARSLREMGIDHPVDLRAFDNWNGRDGDFYFTAEHPNWMTRESFLVKADRSGRALSLVSPQFQFQAYGCLDATAAHYLYLRISLESNDNAGVYLRDLKSNSERRLAAPESNVPYDPPRFYGNGVIYHVGEGELWRVDLKGSNRIRLFPPPQ